MAAAGLRLANPGEGHSGLWVAAAVASSGLLAAWWAVKRYRQAAEASPGPGVEYIFCINTGRSGSEYLAKVFTAARGTVVEHEAHPILCGTTMISWNEGHDAPMMAAMPEKLGAIRAAKGPAGRKRVYVETNHTFIKGWGHLIPKHIPPEKIGVVVLTRDPQKIAESLLRIHDIPGAVATNGRSWYLSPGQQRNLSEPPQDATRLQLCRWYVDEIALRAEKYIRDNPKITFVRAELSQLNDPEFVLSMFDAFGLQPNDAKLTSTVGVAANSRPDIPTEPLSVLNGPSKFPSADSLTWERQAEIMEEMLDMVHNKHRDTRSKWTVEPGLAYIPGSLFMTASKHVHFMRHELEERFEVSLVFSSFLSTLPIMYLLEWAPDDLFLQFIELPSAKAAGMSRREALVAGLATFSVPITMSKRISLLNVAGKLMGMGFVGSVRMLWLATYTEKALLSI